MTQSNKIYGDFSVNLLHYKPAYSCNHLKYSHRVLKVTLSMLIENGNYYYQIVEYQLFHIGLIYQSSIVNLYKVCAYVTILKAKHSSMDMLGVKQYYLFLEKF